MSAKRLYRVVATYPDGRVWKRDYQSIHAAHERRCRILDEAEVIVVIEPSDPITWPQS